MSKHYSIKDITIERTPGFPFGKFPEVTGLTKALNVIWGPNGIGKTTLAQALHSMIWKSRIPDTLEAGALIGSGSENDEWRSSVQQGNIKQIRLADNQQMPLPGRNDEMAEIYWFSLSDFLKSEDKTQPFHKIIYSEMQGGIDIEKAAVEAGSIKRFSSSGQKETKVAKQARDTYRARKHDQKEVNNLSSEIQKINRRLSEKPELIEQRKLLEKALEMSETLSTIEKDEIHLREYSPQIKNVNSYSYQQYENIIEKFENQVANKENLEEEIDNKKSQLHDCSVHDDLIQDLSIIERLNGLESNLDEHSRNSEACSREFQQAEKALEAWEREHSWIVPTVPDKTRLLSSIEKLKAVAMNFEPVRSKLASKKSYADLLGEDETTETDTGILAALNTHLKDLIKQYLSFESQKNGKNLTLKKKNTTIVFSATATVISLILGIVINPLLLLFALSVPVGLFLMLPANRAESEIEQEKVALEKTLEKINEELGDIGFNQIHELELSELTRLHNELEASLRRAKELEIMNQERDKARRAYANAREDLTALYTEWQTACKDIGIDPANPRLENSLFFNFSPHLLKWIELVESVETKRVALDMAATGLESVRDELWSILKNEEKSIDRLKSEAKSLAGRIQKARDLTEAIKSSTMKLKVKKIEIAKIKTELEEFWEKVGLSPEEELHLKALADQRADWDAINLALTANNERVEKIQSQNPDVSDICAKLNKDEIRTQIETLEKQLVDLEQIGDNLAEKKARYMRYTEGSNLADSEYNYSKALETLELVRKEQVLGRTIDILATMIENESEEFAIPEVLKLASGWLERITANRYKLRVDKRNFFAYDTVRTMNLSLDELSDGTRIQLLFAVRMGFISVQEMSTGIRLPIIMDELLANSDDGRALKIIRAIKEIAAERQVFYFTAQSDEVEKFRHYAEDVFNEVSLSNLFTDHSSEKQPLIAFTSTSITPPDPVDDYYEYGKILGVSGTAIWSPIEELHSWYLFLNTADLYEYLCQGRYYVGQLSLTDPVLHTRFEFLQHAQRIARIGRSRPLTISDLEDIDIKVNTESAYWGQIQEFLTDPNNDGNLLLEALEQGIIKNLRGNIKQELIEWLEENNFVNSEPALSIEKILSNLLTEYPDFSKGSGDYNIVERYLHQVIC
jgi:uncharacterized protein YhaN